MYSIDSCYNADPVVSHPCLYHSPTPYMCGGAGSMITRLVMCRWPVLAQAGRGGAAADAGAEEARGQGQERHPLRGGRDGDPDPHHGQDIQGDTGYAGAGHRQP